MDTLKVKDYKMITHGEYEEHEHVDKFDNLINEYIEKGYILYGLPTVVTVGDYCVIYAQAVILFDEQGEVDK